MTKNEAYKTFRCLHCVYLDREEGVCLVGDPESDDCPRDEGKEEDTKNDRERSD